MAILDVFKKKEEKTPEKPKAPKKEKVVLDKEVKPVEKTEKKVSKPKERKSKGIYYDILKSPHVTEKASVLAEKNQYVFKVWPRAHKLEIQKAVENLYGVNVTAVRIINIPKKAKRVGKSQGFKKGYKKAIVCLKKGQKIELISR